MRVTADLSAALPSHILLVVVIDLKAWGPVQYALAQTVCFVRKHERRQLLESRPRTIFPRRVLRLSGHPKRARFPSKNEQHNYRHFLLISSNNRTIQ